jgi:hypothetical protein
MNEMWVHLVKYISDKKTTITWLPLTGPQTKERTQDHFSSSIKNLCTVFHNQNSLEKHCFLRLKDSLWWAKQNHWLLLILFVFIWQKMSEILEPNTLALTSPQEKQCCWGKSLLETHHLLLMSPWAQGLWYRCWRYLPVFNKPGQSHTLSSCLRAFNLQWRKLFKHLVPQTITIVEVWEQKPNHFKGEVGFSLSTIWKTTRFSKNSIWERNKS